MLDVRSPIRCIPRWAALLFALVSCANQARAGDAEDLARIRRAVAYLDSRQVEWGQFSKAQRGEGADRTACVSCHSGIGFILARPSLRRFAATAEPSEPERRINTAVTLRVHHRAELDSDRFELMYDFEERKKIESRGTEAVLNALVLAREDAAQGLKQPGDVTRIALRDLWAAQLSKGENAGAWDWLNFGLEPWEANGSRAFGAALAAIAVGKAPGYLGGALDDRASAGVKSLRDYLRRRYPHESLYNRLWILEASSVFPGLLSAVEQGEVIDQLIAARRADGGWALASLGDYKRVDGSAQTQETDGHATGLVVHAMLRAGISETRPELAQGLAWLRSHQNVDGSWPARSLNKERDPATFIGRFMSDSATAMAAEALGEVAR